MADLWDKLAISTHAQIVIVVCIIIVMLIIGLVFGKKMPDRFGNILGWLFLLILGFACFVPFLAGSLRTASDLTIDADYTLEQDYIVHGLKIEDDYLYMTSRLGGAQATEHSFYHPASVEIDGERYYTYVTLNDGARTNYVSNNKYSPNNSKEWQEKRMIPYLNKNVEPLFKEWCVSQNIDENHILGFGLG